MSSISPVRWTESILLITQDLQQSGGRLGCFASQTEKQTPGYCTVGQLAL